MHRQRRDTLDWMRERTQGAHARGTNIIPFSVKNIDEVLSDVGLGVGVLTRAKQWLLPIDPGDYKHVAPALARRLQAAAQAHRGGVR